MQLNQNFGRSESNTDQKTIAESFIHIHNPTSSKPTRKAADTFLIQCQKQIVPFLKILMLIYHNQNNLHSHQIRLQSLICLSNVIKRNWNNKRLTKNQQQLPQLKRNISIQLIIFLQNNQRIFMKSLFDIVGFIVKSDYPHSFPQFTNYTLTQLKNIQINEQNVRIFKSLRDIFIQLAEKKGFTNYKNYQEGPITQALREQLCKIQDVNKNMAKLSKYCDQMMISLMRIAPYSYLDNQNFMVFIKHITQKLQTLLTSHSNQTISNRSLLQKDIKSIVYQLGCLQVANPCIMGPILSDYISTLFYIISKPEVFSKPATIKYGLLSMKKLIKQFTYYAQNQAFQKSVSSQPKSSNYLQLRKMANQAYNQFMNEDTVQGLFNFLINNIMNIKCKQDQGFAIGFDDNLGSATGYEKSTQKQLSVHVCGTLLVQSLIQRFTEKMLQIIYSSLQICIQANWTNIDKSTLINFLSILSILPKSCKRSHINILSQFPIISILQFVHSSGQVKLKQKFPALISGWLDIFTNQQLGQLIQVLLNYVTQGAQQTNIEILLYSCYSLNKIVTLRSSAVNCGLVLNRVFPVAIKIFDHTDNPQILWPLINLISTLLTKCQFDTNIIVSSVQSNSLTYLIANQSQMLVQALCQMFKSFLCIIPRNKPAVAVFKLVYHFLNIHLAKTSAVYHQKCVSLWYYSIRQFSSVNQCNEEYYELFQNHYRRCMLDLKPVLIYILEQYMLLGLIQSKLESFVATVIQFYRQGQFLQATQNALNSIGQPSRQQSINLKIAALSFQITLITKYNIQQVNSQQMLYAIIKDFCTINLKSLQSNQTNNVKIISTTLQNSLLSIVNRYILLYPDYFFNFLKVRIDLSAPMFYSDYFKNMEHLTSRTAMRINSLALISLLDKVQQQFVSSNQGSQLWPCILTMLKFIIPEVQNHIKTLTGQQGFNVGRIQNSPTIRFSQSILSQRKQQIRKQGSFDNVDIRQYFLVKFKQTIDKLGTNLINVAIMMQSNQEGRDWQNRLLFICK